MNIPMKIHWSMFLFMIYIPVVGVYKKMEVMEIVLLCVITVLILGSVLLHELGHAYAARNLDIKTHDIVLSLIGGVARLEKIPEDPYEEFKVAIAGPLVNLVIACVLVMGLLISFGTGMVEVIPTFKNFINPDIFLNSYDQPLWIYMMYILAVSNLALFAFNLLPVFPMDGGRIFRAILSNPLGRTKATRIASMTGKILAIGLIICGYYFRQPIWSIIGIFVFLMADIENRQEMRSHRFRQIKADALMSSVYDRVKLVLPIQEVINRHFDTDISTFLIEDSKKKIVGVIDKNILETAMREKTEETPISHYMTQRFALININDDFHSIHNKMIKEGLSIGVVMDYGEVKGIISEEKVRGMY